MHIFSPIEVRNLRPGDLTEGYDTLANIYTRSLCGLIIQVSKPYRCNDPHSEWKMMGTDVLILMTNGELIQSFEALDTKFLVWRLIQRFPEGACCGTDLA